MPGYQTLLKAFDTSNATIRKKPIMFKTPSNCISRNLLSKDP